MRKARGNKAKTNERLWWTWKSEKVWGSNSKVRLTLDMKVMRDEMWTSGRGKMNVKALVVRVHQVEHKGKVSSLAIYWEDTKSTYMKAMGCRGSRGLKERCVWWVSAIAQMQHVSSLKGG
jgi:hypothetical protein